MTPEQFGRLLDTYRAAMHPAAEIAARNALVEALALSRSEGRREGIEEAARAVEREVGTFQDSRGPDKKIDAALRLVAGSVRSLASQPPRTPATKEEP